MVNFSRFPLVKSPSLAPNHHFSWFLLLLIHHNPSQSRFFPNVFPTHLRNFITISGQNSGWWFGTFFIFHILGIIIPIDELIFFRGVDLTTNHIHRLSIDYPLNYHRLSIKLPFSRDRPRFTARFRPPEVRLPRRGALLWALVHCRAGLEADDGWPGDRKNEGTLISASEHGIDYWLVVWNIFCFPIYWAKSSQLTSIFRMGSNHQPDYYV